MRILVDGRVIQDRYHGIGRHTYELVRALSGAADELHVLTSSSEAGRLKVRDLGDRHGVTLHPFVSSVTSPWAQVRWGSVLRRLSPDVVFAPYHLGAPLKHAGVPTVAVLHDCIFETQPTLLPGAVPLARRAFGRAYRLATAVTLKRVDAVATVSQATRHDVALLYNVQIGDAAVFPHGVGGQFFLEPSGGPGLACGGGPAVHAAALTAGLPERYVLHVGVRRPHKNQATLVRAFAELVRRFPDVHLVCVGQQDRRFPDGLDDLVRELGLQRHVHLWSSVDDALLLELYRHASCFAFPSLVEGFGLPLLEAMAAGVPVVASDAVAVVEASAGAAVTVPARDTGRWTAELERVLRDDVWAESLRTTGRAVAAAHTWEATAAKTRRFLIDAVASARSDAP